MRIAIPFCRAMCGAKRSTLGKALAISVAAVLLAAGPVLAEHTRWWRQSSFEDFDKGTAKGVALRSDGKLFLAPHFAEFADANLAYLLALRADSKGNLYAAGGSNGATRCERAPQERPRPREPIRRPRGPAPSA